MAYANLANKAFLFGALSILVLKFLISLENQVHNFICRSKCFDSTNSYCLNCASKAACWNNPLFHRKTFVLKVKNNLCGMFHDSHRNVINNTQNRNKNFNFSLLEAKSSNSGPFFFISLHKDFSVSNRFADKCVGCTNYTGNQKEQINKAGNIYVFLATFIGLNPDGAIRVENKETNIVLIAESFFYNSYSSKYGGSIYVYKGSCIQYRICSINSMITEYRGCHSYVETTNEKESYIIESSLSKGKGYKNCIGLYGGNQLIVSTNISYAECVYNAAYECSDDPSSNLIKFTSIFNNTAELICVMYHNDNNQNVYRCNVIKNVLNKNDNGYGIVLSFCDPLNISFCVFSLNSGKSLFYNFGGKFVVDQCFLDNNDVKNTAASGYEVSLAATCYFVLNHSHLSIQGCEAFVEKKISHVVNPFKNRKKIRIKRR